MNRLNNHVMPVASNLQVITVTSANSMMMNSLERKSFTVRNVAFAGNHSTIKIFANRVGGRDLTFHCDGCGCCMGIALLNNHECKVDRLNEDCAVCMEKLFTSRDCACFLRCGHAMHS